MKRIKKYKQWGIYQNNEKEFKEYGFAITVLHPDNMEYPYLCTPRDSDMEFDDLKSAMEWIDKYND